MNTKALTMFMAALQEGQRSILKTPDYSGKPCYDDGVAAYTCFVNAGELPSGACSALGDAAEVEDVEAYKSCTTLEADWGPNGAKCTEEVKSSAQTGFAACTTGTCGKEFETALTCIYKAIKSECPKTPLCLETTLTSSDSVLALN